MKVLKEIVISLICISIVYGSFSISYAKSLGEIINGGDSFIGAEDSEKQVIDEDSVKDGTSQLYYLALGIAIAAAVIIGTILGIQFIMSGVEGQAKIKEKLLPFVIGCVVVFGAIGIWKITINITQSTFESDYTDYTDGGSMGGGGHHR